MVEDRGDIDVATGDGPGANRRPAGTDEPAYAEALRDLADERKDRPWVEDRHAPETEVNGWVAGVEPSIDIVGQAILAPRGAEPRRSLRPGRVPGTR